MLIHDEYLAKSQKATYKEKEKKPEEESSITFKGLLNFS
jgi:hypothetical protein